MPMRCGLAQAWQRGQAQLQLQSVGGECHNPIVNAELSQASSTAERNAALVMLEPIPGGKRVTLGADKGCDTRDFLGSAGRGTEHHAEQGHRQLRANHPPLRIRNQPEEEEEIRRMLRLVEGYRAPAKKGSTG
jgi:hypothetical protein